MDQCKPELLAGHWSGHLFCRCYKHATVPKIVLI